MNIKEQKHASEWMPKSEEALHILQARAQQLAELENETNKSNGIPFVQFRVGKNESYGVPYQYVQEILQNVSLANPPFVPNFIAGVINWRGALITIVDLIKFFHPNYLKHHSECNNEFIIIIQAQHINLGLLSNQIVGSKIYQPDQLATPLSNVNIAAPEYILGLHNAVTAILNIEAFILGLNQETRHSLYRIGEIHGNG
ncbi:MAG: chemotaxis protein CheW [Legionella longbeachae]|nr:chemotaxis protein CheW [Legionella longbeachae]